MLEYNENMIINIKRIRLKRVVLALTISVLVLFLYYLWSSSYSQTSTKIQIVKGLAFGDSIDVVMETFKKEPKVINRLRGFLGISEQLVAEPMKGAPEFVNLYHGNNLLGYLSYADHGRGKMIIARIDKPIPNRYKGTFYPGQSYEQVKELEDALTAKGIIREVHDSPGLSGNVSSIMFSISSSDISYSILIYFRNGQLIRISYIDID